MPQTSLVLSFITHSGVSVVCASFGVHAPLGLGLHPEEPEASAEPLTRALTRALTFRPNPNPEREPPYHLKVHLGLGLHLGWAIEGTIGSRFKIDASYLSPNVNVAARLEAATHQFGCPLLMSGFLVDEVRTTMNSASQGRPLCAATGGVSIPRRRM